jgi:hypothetical protein
MVNGERTIGPSVAQIGFSPMNMIGFKRGNKRDKDIPGNSNHDYRFCLDVIKRKVTCDSHVMKHVVFSQPSFLPWVSMP